MYKNVIYSHFFFLLLLELCCLDQVNLTLKSEEFVFFL